MRATIRAWASVVGVNAPLRNGTIPSATQRRSVGGETDSARAASVSVSSSAMLDETLPAPRLSDLQVRLLGFDVRAVLVVDRLRDRDQRQRGLQVATGLDP